MSSDNQNDEDKRTKKDKKEKKKSSSSLLEVMKSQSKEGAKKEKKSKTMRPEDSEHVVEDTKKSQTISTNTPERKKRGATTTNFLEKLNIKSSNSKSEFFPQTSREEEDFTTPIRIQNSYQDSTLDDCNDSISVYPTGSKQYYREEEVNKNEPKSEMKVVETKIIEEEKQQQQIKELQPSPAKISFVINEIPLSDDASDNSVSDNSSTISSMSNSPNPTRFFTPNPIDISTRLSAISDTAGFNTLRRERRTSSVGSKGDHNSRPASHVAQRDLISLEIYSTEESYGLCLEHLVTIYNEKMKDMLSEQEHKTIFGTIGALRSFNVKLLEDIKFKMANWNLDSTLGDIFIKYHPFFKMYTGYCNNYEVANECVKACSKRKEIADFIEREKKNSQGLDLDSLLITPVQRIPRIKMLLKELAKYTPENHPDKKLLTDAFNKISDIALSVNESMKNNQNAKFFETLLETVKGIGPYLEVHRKYVMEGQYGVAIINGESNKKDKLKFTEHWLLFFSDMILFATGENKKKRKLVGEITLNSMWIKHGTDKYDSCIEITTPEEMTYFIKISNNEEREKWFDAINDRIKANTKKHSGNTNRTFKYRFSQGGTYEGEWVDAKMHGRGTFIFPNGNVYEGEWKEGSMEGKGKLSFGSGEVYEGDWKNSLQSGSGTMKTLNSRYNGEWKNGKMEGSGEIEWSNGSKYVGEFRNDCMEGTGTLTLYNGIQYTGEFKSNMMHGIGKLTYVDGSEYEGQLFNDRKQGQGKLTYPNGDTYNGNWKNNKKNGVGVFTGLNGRLRIQTQWLEDVPEGTGQFIFKKSLEDKEDYFKYDGDFKAGRREGKGGLQLNGALYSGSWVAGAREGFGAFQDCVGTYQGPWKADKRNGSGVLNFSNDVEFDGDWKDNMVIKGTATFKNDQGGNVTQIYSDGKRKFQGFGMADLPQQRWLL